MWVPDFGDRWPTKTQRCVGMVSRVANRQGRGAYELPAARIASGSGTRRKCQTQRLNRQLFDDSRLIGKPRIESIRRRLLELKPALEIVASRDVCMCQFAAPKIFLVRAVRVVVDCDAAVSERFLMNEQAVADRA